MRFSMSLASRAFFAALLFAAIVPHASAQSTVSFGTTSYSFQETETTMPVRFVRSGNTSAAATLHLALRESPYPSVISHPIVMMNAGETETIINIHPFWYWYTDWDWIPNPRVYTLTIDTVDGATIGGASMATISVAEVHTPLTFTIDDVTVVEGGGPGLPSVAVFIIRRNRDDFGTLPHFVLHDGTAKAGVDYQQPASSQLPDSMEVQLKIPIIGNAAPEGDRTFTVELTNGQGPGVKSIGTCTILDDDGAIGPPVLKIEKGGKGTISVDFGSPAASSEQVTLSSLDPSIVSVPPSITIPAGASTGSAEATAGNPGGTLITATAPLSRGGRTFQIDASTYEPGALAFER